MTKLLFMKLKIENRLANYHYDQWEKFCHDGLGIYESEPYAGIIRKYYRKMAAYHLKRLLKYQNKVFKSCMTILNEN